MAPFRLPVTPPGSDGRPYDAYRDALLQRWTFDGTKRIGLRCDPAVLPSGDPEIDRGRGERGRTWIPITSECAATAAEPGQRLLVHPRSVGQFDDVAVRIVHVRDSNALRERNRLVDELDLSRKVVVDFVDVVDL